ncbi:hypothetical protein HK405_010705, partial [Cladochytrium tenue]
MNGSVEYATSSSRPPGQPPVAIIWDARPQLVDQTAALNISPREVPVAQALADPTSTEIYKYVVSPYSRLQALAEIATYERRAPNLLAEPTTHESRASSSRPASNQVGSPSESAGIASNHRKYGDGAFRTSFSREGRKGYRCDMCDKVVVRMTNMRAHILTHDPSRPRFRCSRCDDFFTRPADLRRHERSVHCCGSAPLYACPACGARMKRKDSLHKHMNVCGALHGPDPRSSPPVADTPAGKEPLQTPAASVAYNTSPFSAEGHADKNDHEAAQHVLKRVVTNYEDLGGASSASACAGD